MGGKLYRRDTAGRWASRKLLPAYAGEGVQALVKDRRGRIWLRGRQMLLRLERFDAPVQDLSASLPGAAVKKRELHLDAVGRIWVPTNHGVVFFDGNDSGLIDDARGLPNEWATTVLVDWEGSLWIGSEGVHRIKGRLAWTAINSGSFFRVAATRVITAAPGLRSRPVLAWHATRGQGCGADRHLGKPVDSKMG